MFLTAELNAGLLKYLRAFDVSGASTSLTKALKLVSSSLPSARGVIIDMFVEVYLNEKVRFEITVCIHRISACLLLCRNRMWR